VYLYLYKKSKENNELMNNTIIKYQSLSFHYQQQQQKIILITMLTMTDIMVVRDSKYMR